MSVITRSTGKSNANTNIPDNTEKLVSPADVRESIIDLWDSAIMKKGDSGISGVISYGSLFTLTNDSDIVYKKYVDDAVSGIDLSGYIKADGTIAFTGDQSLGGNNLTNVLFITDSGNNAAIGLDDRFLYDNTGLNNLARFADPAQGFGVKTSAFYANLKTTNLSADRDYEFPDYDFAFPASAPGSNTFLKYDGANYVWAAGGGSGITSVNGDSGPSVIITVTGTTNRVTVSGGTGITPTIDIAATYVGQASITTLGTITTGVWNGTAITNANLANSSVTINGTAVSLGASATVTAAAGTLTGTTLNATVVTSSLTTVGTIGTGVWNGTVVTGQYGGTGVANTGKTITISGNLTTTGAFNLTLAVPQSTTYTLPNTANETLAGLGTAQTFTASQTIASGSNITVASDTDSTNIFGRVRLYSATSDQAMFAHFDISTASDYALQQNSLGTTELNGSAVNIKINNSAVYTITLTTTTYRNAHNLAFNTTTGTKIGTATGQKIALWNKTPITQPTTSITALTVTANSGTALNDASTYGGYTIGQVVAALVNFGLLA